MTNQKLVDYINNSLAKGVPSEKIRQNLLAKGWSLEDIDSAIKSSSGVGFWETLSPKLWFIPVLMISFLAITGVVFYFYSKGNEKIQETPLSENQNNNSQLSSVVVNCGTDMNCLVRSSRNCELAKVTNNVSIDLFGMIVTTTGFYEIKGIERSKCTLYLKNEKQDIKFSDELVQQMLAGGATQEEIDLQEQESNNQIDELTEGKDGLCLFRNDPDLTSLLEKIKSDNVSGGVSCSTDSSEPICTSTGDWSVAECSGEMFESTSS